MSKRSETHGAKAYGHRLPSLPLERDVLVARWRAVPAINYSALRSDLDGTVGRADIHADDSVRTGIKSPRD